MKHFLAYILLTGSCMLSCTAAEHPSPKRERLPSYNVLRSEADPTLDLNHARFELQFEPQLLDPQFPLKIEFSCNGVIEHIALDSTLKTTVDVSPGKYIFQLATNAGHGEIFTDAIEIRPGFRTIVAFHFTEIHEEVLKPVIYLYPPADQPVSVGLKPKGAFTFTYPAYENGWNGTAHPDGSMTIAGKMYPYLFWEGEQRNVTELANYATGFVIEQENVTAFLEEKLTEMGLNSKEQTDFITFWGPKMAQSERGFAQFLFTADYDNIATLDVQPRPDNVFRVYLLWTPIAGSLKLNPKPQTIERIERKGFTVVEWGGSELPAIQSVHGL